MLSFQHELAMLIRILLIYLLSHSFMYIAPSSIQQFIILLRIKACSGVKHWVYNSKQVEKAHSSQSLYPMKDMDHKIG